MKNVSRSAGALAPLFSLPGVRDVGSLGRCARRFVDDLADSGQSWWQMLPINPIDDFGSPYAGRSAFAGEALYLDLEELRDENLLDDFDLESAWFLPKTSNKTSQKLTVSNLINQKTKKEQNTDLLNVEEDEVATSDGDFVDARSERVDYSAAFRTRRPLWEKAFDRYRRGDAGGKFRTQEKRFRENERFWLDDFVLFQTASETFGTPDWACWPSEIRRREPAALADFAAKFAEKLEFLRFLQLVFDVQWNELRDYCRNKSIRLFGDVPIYVGRTSADVWAFPELFEVDVDGRILREAGVPSDDFNPDGQRWSSPIYRWERHRETGFDWWKRRMKKTISRFDVVRLDHFIGFYNYYSFPGEGSDVENAPVAVQNAGTVKTLKNESKNERKSKTSLTLGKSRKTSVEAVPFYEDGWEPGPQEAFFDAIFSECPKKAFVAEDLGVMNEGVRRLRDRYQLPGMNVFEFSFDGVKIDAKTGSAPNPLDAWTENYVAYTGTHDAAPILGWLADVERFGGGAWESLDFAAIANVLERNRRSSDRSAEIVGESDSTKKVKLQETAQKTQKIKGTDPASQNVDVPALGVSKRVVPLPPEVAKLRIATLRAVASTRCRLAIFPIQDVVGLSNDARINFPGVGVGNWTWRLADGALTSEIKVEWRRLTEETGRVVDF